MSLFKEPTDVEGVTFMLFGESGTGKTMFALGAKRVVGRVAYVGTDRGAKFYRNDSEVGGFLQVESRDIDQIRAAITELTTSRAEGFGAVVVDTITDLWEAEQEKYVKRTAKGVHLIPVHAWRPLRRGHEQILRDLQALPVHTFLICELKPITIRVAGEDDETIELKEVGTREDSDKKDGYVADVRLRMFLDRGSDGKRSPKFCAEVIKDRTRHFKVGHIIENPRPEMFISGPATVAAAPAPASNDNDARLGQELLATKFVMRLGAIKNPHEFKSWKKKHEKEILGLPTDLKEKVFAAGKECAERLISTPSEEELEQAGIPPTHATVEEA